jgi:hypothetical protein
MLKIFTTTIFVFIFSFTIIAQSNFVEGNIVTLTNDTIKGQIDYPEWIFTPKQIRFRLNNTDKSKIYTSKDIKAFSIVYKNEQYQRAIVTIYPEQIELTKSKVYNSIDSIESDYVTDTTFLRVLAKGRLNLFELQYNQYQPHYFIQKNNADMTELIRRRVLVKSRDSLSVITVENFKKQLGQLTSDCPINETNFSRIHYQSNELLKVISLYNTCVQESFYTIKKEHGRNTFSIMAGMMRPNSQIREQLRIWSYGDVVDIMENKTLPLLALSLEQSFSRIFSKLGIGEELNLAYVDITHKKEVTYSLSEKTFVYSLKSWAIKGSGYVRYYLRNGNMQPYIKGGIGLMYYTNPKFTLQEITSTPFPDLVETTGSIKKIKPNYMLGLGVKYKNFFIETRYDGWIDKNENYGDIILIRRPAVFAGYSWLLNKKKLNN